jgi:hypothetical protein
MSVRQTDMVGRMGGDEFALILPDTSKAAANTVLRKVSRMLERGMKQNGWRITFSIGAVTFLAPPVSVQEMIAGADQAMFAVKNSGKQSAGLLQPKCRYSRGLPRRTLKSHFAIREITNSPGLGKGCSHPSFGPTAFDWESDRNAAGRGEERDFVWLQAVQHRRLNGPVRATKLLGRPANR